MRAVILCLVFAVLSRAQCVPSGPVPQALLTCRNWITFAPPAPFNPNLQNAGNLTQEQIRQSLTQLYQEGWRGLVTYAMDGPLEHVPRIAKEAGFVKVIAGIYWFSSNGLQVEREAVIRQLPWIDGIVVGNEGLLNCYSRTDLEKELTTLKATGKPVTTSESHDRYVQDPSLLSLGDWAFPNVQPWWANVRNPEQAATWTRDQYNDFQAHLPPGRIIVIKEAWWPTAGGFTGTEASQAAFFSQLAATPVRFIWGEAYDQTWKVDRDQGPFWGLHTAAQVPKRVIQELQTVYSGTYPPASAPENVDLLPFTGSGASEVFTLTLRDRDGWSNIERASMVIHQALAGAGGCYVEYERGTRAIRLRNDTNSGWAGPVMAGTSWVLENRQCTVGATGSTAAGSNETLTVSFSITFKPGFTGKKTVYTRADDGLQMTSEWSALGNWWPNMITGRLVNRYRLFNPFSRSHLHTTDLNEYTVLGSMGFTQEGVGSRIYDAMTTVNNVAAVPFYQIYNVRGLRHFWTADRNEYLTLIRFRSDYQGEAGDGFVLPAVVAGTVPLYRLVHCIANPVIHHWTPDVNEHTVLSLRGDWMSEGPAAYVFPP